MREYYGGCNYKNVDVPGIGLLKMVYSTELEQDTGLYLKLLFLPKTGPITEAEITDWKEIDKKLQTVDHNEVKKRYSVAILRDESDFRYYEDWL